MKNKNLFQKTGCLAIFLISSLISWAQGTFSQDSLLNEGIILPPLEELLGNIQDNPRAKFYQIKKEEETSTLKTQKKDWLKFFHLNAGYQWGMGATTAYSNDGTPFFYESSGNRQNLYNVGVSVSIPFNELIDRKNRIKKQKLQIEAMQKEMESWQEDQSLKIIDLYTDAEQLLDILKIKTEALTMANTQYKFAQDDYVQGKIPIEELNNRKSLQVNAYVNYIQTKKSLKKAILQLEIISNTKIIK